MIRVGHAIISVCCELPHNYAGTGPSARRCHADSARPGWSDTRRRIGGSFTRTSQAFARFNPEIRTGAAELSEHSARRPRPRVGRGSDAWWSIPYLIVLCPGVVRRPTVEPLPDTGDVATPVSAEALRQRACLLLVPRSTHRIPQAGRKREIWVGEGGGRGGGDSGVSRSVVGKFVGRAC